MELTVENIKKVWLTDEAVCIETKAGKEGKELHRFGKQLMEVSF
jgi:hypothetical protein